MQQLPQVCIFFVLFLYFALLFFYDTSFYDTFHRLWIMCALSFFLSVSLLFLLLFVIESNALSGGAIVCAHDQLFAPCVPVLPPGARPEIWKELRRRLRGCRSGVRVKDRKRRHKPAVPAIIMGNVPSLDSLTLSRSFVRAACFVLRRRGCSRTSRTTASRHLSF